MNAPKTSLNLWLTVALLTVYPAMAQTNFTILKSFTSVPDGNVPFSTLVADSNGLLYGTTTGGGISNQGTIFVIHTNAYGYKSPSGYATLASFTGGTNAAYPYAGLVLSTNGNLYGTTFGGGISNFGTVFTIRNDGSGLGVLHSFVGGTDGENPRAALIEASDGTLYGTTYFANSSNRGTIFKINNDGSGYATLHTFTGNPDGQQTQGRLLEGSDGVLYGTAGNGGIHYRGMIFFITKDGGSYGTLYDFGSITGDGSGPVAGLIEASDHALYGTTYSGGGTGANGTVFKINKDSSGYQILHGFSTSNGDGQRPNGELVEGLDGAIYGGTDFGGVGSVGVIYKLNKDGGGYQILRNFSSGSGDGHDPKCGLLQLANGILYGTTEFGAVGGAGCVFALSTAPLPPRIQSLTISGNTNLLQCFATSTVLYDIQLSTNLSAWTILATKTSQTNGQLNYTNQSPPLTSAFYRLQQHQ